jgi:hypothetical protein
MRSRLDAPFKGLTGLVKAGVHYRCAGFFVRWGSKNGMGRAIERGKNVRFRVNNHEPTPTGFISGTGASERLADF